MMNKDLKICLEIKIYISFWIYINIFLNICLIFFFMKEEILMEL